MKLLSHPAVTALGATTIIFMVWLAPLASGFHETLYTHPGSVAAVVVPLYIGFFCTWLFWTLVLLLSRHHGIARIIVWTVLAVILCRELLEASLALRPTDDPLRPVAFPSTHTNIVFALCMAVLVVALPVLRYRKPRFALRAKWLGTTILGFVGFSGVLTLLQIASYTWQARNLNTPQPQHQAVAAGTPVPGGHRIVWILFDELSYRQLYEHRFSDLQMPAFDGLAKEATVFTDVRPQGKLTLDVIPALLSGVSDTDIRIPASGAPLSVKNSDTGKYQLFNPQQTVFQDAVNAGYSTAVAGWIFPYCRLLPQQLDRCFYAAPGGLVADLSTTQTIAENVKQLFTHPFVDRAVELRLMKRPPAPQPPDVPKELYKQLLDHSVADIQDPSVNFLYIHMNIPHPKGYFNRHTGQFVENGTYIDNLALADIFLGHIRSALEATGSWDNTTLIIMGDHSWRTYGWSKDMYWTPEEQLASDGGKFDDRPGYIVKLAGQTTPARIDTPFPAIRTRSLVKNLIQNKITTPEQLAAWVNK